MELLDFDCPRCASPTQARFYGPCAACREALAASGREGRTVEVEYVPKMNVVPNQIATKD